MSSKLGSSLHAARVATGVLLEKGWSRLESLVGGHVASFGESCWQTDTKLSEVLQRPDGRGYHPESIARSRRKLRDAGVISSQRVFVNGLMPTHAKHKRSSRGTTIKAFNWRAIEQKNPFSRRERRLLRFEQARAAKEAGELVKPPRSPAPRHGSARAMVDPVRMPVVIDPEFARLAERAQSYGARRDATPLRSEASARPGAPERPPPE